MRDLTRIVLPDEQPLPSPYAEADRRQAVADLLAGNTFRPKGLNPGPYALAIAVRDGRLILDIRDEADAPLHALVLALGPRAAVHPAQAAQIRRTGGLR